MIEFQEYIELLRSLVRIPSLSRDEGAACDCLEGWLRAHGLVPERKGHNLWLTAPAAEEDAPVIMLNAHIDTVKPNPGYTRDPFDPELDGDKLWGLGTNDDGGSLVAGLAAFIELSSRPQPFKLIWSATSAEEVCGREGIDLIFDEIGPVDLGVMGEPTQMQMAVAEKGLMVLDCTAAGKSGHAARNEGVNAIYEALKDIDWFRIYQFPRVSEHLGSVKMSVTMINAGTQHNVVPAECTFVVDVRPNGMYSNVELLGLIKEQVHCTVKERSTRINSSSIDVSHPVVQRGLSLGLTAFGSPTTSNQALCNFTTIKIGPGDSARSHTADEFILVSEIRSGIDTYVRLLDGLKLR